MESYLLMNSTIGLYMNQASTIPNIKRLYITGMHQMVPSYLCYLILIIAYIGIHLRNYESGLWIHLERYSM